MPMLLVWMINMFLGLHGVGDCACDQAGRRGLVTVLVTREEMNMVDREGFSGDFACGLG